MALVGFDYLHAEWTPPTKNPPQGNIDIPINIGTTPQTKRGALGAAALSITGESQFNGKIKFPFKNTTANVMTEWNMQANDGTGNFNVYLNSSGGNDKKIITTGYANKELYNPGNGIYYFQSSGSSIGAGSIITWKDTFKIFPDGRVGAVKYCDINGNNCSVSSDESSVSIMGKIGSTGNYWPDVITCNASSDGVTAGVLLTVAGGVYSDTVTYKFPVNRKNDGNEVMISFKRSNGSYDNAQGLSNDCTERSIQNYISAGEAYYYSSGWSNGKLPVKYAWQFNQKTACNAPTPPNTCGGSSSGTITYDVYCARSDNPTKKVANKNCPSPKPESSQTCYKASTAICGP